MSDSSPVLTFLGATGTVTGSRFLVDAGDARVLVDCGLYQGIRELRDRNWEPFPVPPDTVDAVVLTHAHLDHCGYLPLLAREGFHGLVHTTLGTADLAALVLRDSAHIQEEDAAYAARAGFSKHARPRPLYTGRDVEAVLRRFRPVPFGEPVGVAGGVRATLRRAGHILGSATVCLDLPGGRHAFFSGDVGRPGHPLLRPPDPPPAAETFVVESTYGDRRHDDAGTAERLASAITRTIDRGGSVLVPAFAVDRTEVVLRMLRRLTADGLIPKVPVFVDSPMAIAALRTYRTAIETGAADIRDDVDTGDDPFDTGWLHELGTAEESMRVNDPRTPCVVVSASGMATGGRVLHHLAHMLPQRRHTVVLVGYQSLGTRGRALADGAHEVKMLGRYVPVRAEVVDLPAFSVHADCVELVDWLRQAERPPETCYLVHGEPRGAAALRDRIRAELGWTVVVPRHGERVRLD